MKLNLNLSIHKHCNQRMYVNHRYFVRCLVCVPAVSCVLFSSNRRRSCVKDYWSPGRHDKESWWQGQGGMLYLCDWHISLCMILMTCLQHRLLIYIELSSQTIEIVVLISRSHWFSCPVLPFANFANNRICLDPCSKLAVCTWSVVRLLSCSLVFMFQFHLLLH